MQYLNIKYMLRIIFFAVCLSVASTVSWSGSLTVSNRLYSDNAKLIYQQTELLKNRLTQAQIQLASLRSQQDDSIWEASATTRTTKQLRSQGALDVSVAKSNVDSINIELSESQQTLSRLDNEIQEIENQLNVFDVFGLKLAHNETINVKKLQTDLAYQKNLLDLEKTRNGYLRELENLASTILQLQKTKYARMNILLKTRIITQLKQQQARSEVNFEQEQSYWLQQLNLLYTKLNQAKSDKSKDKNFNAQYEREIFYANENLNFTYLQMLIVRYQDQLQQLRIAISHSGSITLLNKASAQVQLLSKQILRVKDLLNKRVDILDQRKIFLLQDKDSNAEDVIDLARLSKLDAQYQAMKVSVTTLNERIFAFHVVLDQALQYELSSRQGLPGLNSKAWFDLGAEIWFVPTLAFQVVKSLSISLTTAIKNIDTMMSVILVLLESVLIGVFIFGNRFLAKIVSSMAEHEFGHINLKRLSIQILRRNLVDIFLIGNSIALLEFFSIPTQSSSFFINLMLVWLFFKSIITLARVCLVETTHDRAGHDVRLYHRLKWTFLVGGIVTAITVFVHQLPVIYELKDLCDRLFLLFLLVASVFLLKSWEVLPELILHHVDARRLYLTKIVRLLGLLVPLILLINSAIGLFGFVNLVLTISWYESVFLLVLVGYLIVRGLLIDGMVFVSTLLIAHVGNGWLWTEAFLKPLDKVLRIVLFFMAWAFLFVCYGWNQQSPVVTQLNNLLNYHIVDMLNTSITVLSIVELSIIVSFLHWAARWSREFVYRLLLSRTKDLGLRNSLAIFSQYLTIAVGIFICLRIIGIDLKALAFVATGLAFAIGLGLRDLANNFACGFLLLIERPIRVGDTVSVGTYEGEVTHIGGRAITIRTWDHVEVIVPNTEIFTKSFMNWTAKDHIVRTIIPIKINRHDSPLEVQAIIMKVLSSHANVLTDPLPEVFLKELSDALIEFEVRYFVNLRQIKSRIGLRSEVLMAIWQAFEAHEIHPPYPYHEIHVKNSSTPGVPILYGQEKLLTPIVTSDI